MKYKFPNGKVLEIRDEFKMLAERHGGKPVKETKQEKKEEKK